LSNEFIISYFTNSESREILLEDNAETSNKKLKEIGQLEARTGQ
jgi:hypothetical protein